MKHLGNYTRKRRHIKNHMDEVEALDVNCILKKIGNTSLQSDFVLKAEGILPAHSRSYKTTFPLIAPTSKCTSGHRKISQVGSQSTLRSLESKEFSKYNNTLEDVATEIILKLGSFTHEFHVDRHFPQYLQKISDVIENIKHHTIRRKNAESARHKRCKEPTPRFRMTHIPLHSSLSHKLGDSFETRKLADCCNNEFSGTPFAIPIERLSIKFKEIIGKGSSSIVYKGKYLGTRVAVKKFNFSMNYDKSNHFNQEVRMLLNLRHPHLLMMIGVSSVESKPLIVFEMMSKGNLQVFLQDFIAGMPLLLANGNLHRQISNDISKGMAYLHGQDPPVLHLDLKSSNILLDDYYRAKIADFGFSKTWKAAKVVFKNKDDGSIKVQGTPGWMAPELLSNGIITKKTDVYSFGIILWELTTHLTPFKGISLSMMRRLVVNKKIRPEIPSWCPRNIADLITKCWDPIANNRPDFLSVLEEINYQHQSKENLDDISEYHYDNLHRNCDISYRTKSCDSTSNIKQNKYEEISIEGSSGIGEMCSNISTKSSPSAMDKQEPQINDETALNEIHSTKLFLCKNDVSIPLPPKHKPETVQAAPLKSTPLKSEPPVSSTSHIPFNAAQLSQQKTKLKRIFTKNVDSTSKSDKNGFTDLLKKAFITRRSAILCDTSMSAELDFTSQTWSLDTLLND